MRWRWVMHWVLLGMSLLCVCGWWWSVRHAAHVRHVSSAGGFVDFGVKEGTVYSVWGHEYPGTFYGHPSPPEGWSGEVLATPQQVLPNTYFSWPMVMVAGFGYLNDTGRPDWGCGFSVPLWFLAALSGVGVVFVWRTTWRRRPGGAFPVVRKEEEP